MTLNSPLARSIPLRLLPGHADRTRVHVTLRALPQSGLRINTGMSLNLQSLVMQADSAACILTGSCQMCAAPRLCRRSARRHRVSEMLTRLCLGVLLAVHGAR
jgi:hypothetical protein